MSRRLLNACLLLLILSPSLALAADPVPDKVWVVAIGVGKYTYNFSALRGASEAARGVAAALKTAMPEVTTAYELTDDAPLDLQRPRKENVLETFIRLGNEVGPNDRVIVYFCGHGVEYGNEPYLLLMNVSSTRDRERLDAGAMRVAWLREKMDGLGCRERLLWLDACRVEALALSGAGDGTEHAGTHTQAMMNAAQLRSDPAVASATFFGCRAGERVWHSKDGAPFFTKALIEGLEGKATDDQGRITLSSLADYAQGRVPTLIRSEGLNVAQHPSLYPAQVPTTKFVLRPSPGAVAIPRFAGRYGELFAINTQTYLASTGELILVERMRMDDALRELKLQSTDLVESRTAKRLGEMVGAAYVLVGESIEYPGNRLQVNVRLVEVATAKQVPKVAGQCLVDPDDSDTFKPALQRLADELLVGMRAAGISMRRGPPPPPPPPGPGVTIPGRLRVESTPSGAQVFVGGEDTPRGVTPLTIDNLPAGKVIVQVRREGYGEKLETAHIEGGKQSTLRVDLPQLQGAVVVKTTPPGARVYIDGQDRGVTTAEGLRVVGLPIGRHQARITLADHAEETREFEVKFGATRDLSVALRGTPGSVIVSTVPSGASVTVDGSAKGTTPVTVRDVPAGTHTVAVALSGYGRASKQVTVAANRSEAVSFVLEAIEKAQIEVSSTPSGASVYVNGRLRGTTPAVITLDEIGEQAQTIEVEARLSGYESASSTERLGPGDQRTLAFTLRKQTTPTAPGGFVYIKPGTFTMGSPSSESNRESNETQHQVTITKGFYIGATEVTQEQYQAVMGTNPSKFKGAKRPVEQVSWNDAVEFCNKLSTREGLTRCYSGSGSSITCNWNATGYRLPTEAEWEYACRAGTTGPFHTGSCLSTSDANYDGNYPLSGCSKGQYRQTTWDVGSGAKNAWGLYDMHGNVREWCWDWYGSYSSGGSQTDPRGASSGSSRVDRGGSWFNYARGCRSADRNDRDPGFRYDYFGFRVVRAPGQR